MRHFVVIIVLMLSVMRAAVAAPGDATIAGIVRGANGAPVAGASVDISGPAHAATSTDASGAFSATLAPGLYRVVVSKGGFLPAEADDVALVAGETVPLNVVMTPASLSSLQTIAHVTVNGASSINVGAAATNYLTAAQVANMAEPQVNLLLQTLPGVSIQHLSSSPNTTISLDGTQPYETQVLLDGHPLSGGTYGAWLSQYFNPYLLQGAEVETGPGNTTPFAGSAVGGTVNLLTTGFTSGPTAELLVGSDSYLSQYSNLVATDKVGRFSYVLQATYDSLNGPFFDNYTCIVTPQSTANDNKPGATGIIQYCGNSSGSLYNKGEILKLKYDFSPSTSLWIGYVGAQGGFLPQGSSYANYLGVTTIVPCLSGSKSYECTNPNFSQYTGQQVNAYGWYPGSNVHNNMPLFEGELRTSIGDNTLLVRPYAGDIGRFIDGSGEADYPIFYVPNADAAECGKNGYGTGPSNGGLTECIDTPYSTFEFDKLYGSTFSFIHPLSAGLLSLNYDFHGDNTNAHVQEGSVYSPEVPNTTARYSTVSLTGDVGLTEAIDFQFGLYDDIWHLIGEQSYTTPGGAVASEGLDRSVSRFDPHLALVFRPNSNVSYRVSYGTSETFPFASQVSGVAFLTLPSATGNPYTTFTEKNPYLSPETSSEFDVGMDRRFGSGGVLSLDLESITIDNVFETLETPVTNPSYSYIIEPLNVAHLNGDLAILKYVDEPSVGFGYRAGLTLTRSIVNGLPLSFYGTAYALPANGQQQCGISSLGGTLCIPYLKAFGALQYTWPSNDFVSLSADFEGKNNPYDEPPFTTVYATLRHPVTKNLDVQLSVDNLLNTNTFYDAPMPNVGVPLVGENKLGLGSVVSPLIPAEPRTFRLGLRWHYGR